MHATTSKCKRGGRHSWQPDGGCKENPGVFDNGNGGLIYSHCAKCGATRKRSSDYTGCRPGNNFPWRYDFGGDETS